MEALKVADRKLLARGLARLGVVLCGLTLLTGCAAAALDSASAPPGGASSSPAPSATVGRTSPARPGDPSAVVEAYRRFWVVVLRVEALPQSRWPEEFARVAVDPLLTRVYDGLRAEVAAGSRQYGTVVTHPTVVDLRDGRAAVVDCQDASRSGVADAGTGLPSTVGDPRTPVAATLVRGRDGTWRLSEARYLPGPC